MQLDLNPVNLLDKEYSVSELSFKIKHTIETQYSRVKIRGEISGFKVASSGHGYLNLKDQNSILACTCWKHVLAKTKIPLSDGIEVLAIGNITTYAGQSRYQLNIEHIMPSGIGMLMQIFQQRKEKLAAEGLFDIKNKKKLPFFPKTIGIITSITGSVIKDILHRIADRCPTRLLIWHTSVQGQTAAEEITMAISSFNKLKERLKPDVIIIARGGGSIEDLWPFNEENLVRAIFNSHIPIISAIGHETDFTLSDFVADVRAPTPTAAAEFAVPVIAELKNTLSISSSRLSKIIQRCIMHKIEILTLQSKIINTPEYFINHCYQKLDDVYAHIENAFSNIIKTKYSNLDRLNINKKIIIRRIELYDITLQKSYQKFVSNILSYINRIENLLTLNSRLLTSLDIKQILKKGFTIVRSNKKILLCKPLDTSEIDIEFHDGIIKAKIHQ